MTPSASTRWMRIRAHSPSEALAGVVSEGLIASGGTAVLADGECLSTWLPEPAPPATAETFIMELRARLTMLAGQPIDIDWDWQPDDDWLVRWRAGLQPRRVGRRLIVAPTWTTPDARNDDIVIRIDPQMAFGTGEHASTRGVLRLLEDAVRPGVTMLDAGTGSAVLAIAALRLGAASVDAVDVEADAILNASENVERNGCADRIRLSVGEVSETWLDRSATRWDIIAANILSSVVCPLLPAFRRHLENEGVLLVGGMLESEATGVIHAARTAGFDVIAEDREEGWWSARLEPAE